MKTIKYILSTLSIIVIIWGCTNDDLNNLDFLESAEAPTNVDALITITQDNTGLVSIAPSAEGAVLYDINFGDASTPETVKVGKKATHTYAEGNYTVGIIAKGVTGLTTDFSKEIVVSFNPPEFGTEPIIENDPIVSKKVNVTVPDDTKWAMFYDAHFEENGIETILTANVGDKVSYNYENPGFYTIKIVLKGGAIATTEYIKTDFEVTEILQPIASATRPPGRAEVDYISIFSDVYNDVAGTNYNPWWWQSTIYAPFDLNGDGMLQYSNLNYQGIEFGSDVDAVATSMEYIHIDVWTPDVTAFEFYLISRSSGEKYVLNDLVVDQWNSFNIPLSEFTDQGLSLNDLFQIKIVGSPWAPDGFGSIFVDNIYFWKAPSAPSPLAGTWRVAPETGAIAVGPNPNDLSWWYLNQWGDDVTTRACWLDDEYVFNNDGTFANILGSETWLEPWQGVDPEACGAPIAPHDGSNPATWSSTDTTITINGTGAFLGLAKVHNSGEDGAPPSNSITYDYVLSDGGNTLELKVVGYGGTGGTETWYFKLIKQ